jgi:hypothetical protein
VLAKVPTSYIEFQNICSCVDARGGFPIASGRCCSAVRRIRGTSWRLVHFRNDVKQPQESRGSNPSSD